MGVLQVPNITDEPWLLQMPGSFNRQQIPIPEGSLTRRYAESALIAGRRELRVYLPPGYEADGEATYPVLFVQNGQNIFARDDARAPTPGGMKWDLDLALDNLIHSGRMRPIIAVAVWHNPDTCIADYTCPGEGRAGAADRYLEFLMTELKPFLDKNYRTDPAPAATGVMGGSLGGHFSIYAGATDRRVGIVLGLSPSPLYGDEILVDTVNKIGEGGISGRFFLDTGDQEPAQAWDGLDRVAHALEQRLVSSDANVVIWRKPQGGRHSEASWGERIRHLLPMAFPPLHRS